MILHVLQPDILQDYLRRRGWLDNEEIISSIEKLSQSNVNYTLRVTTPIRRLIIKQSQEAIEQFPTSASLTNRTVIEGSFYQEIQPIPMVANAMPQFLGLDRENTILVLSDLGDTHDYTFLYQSEQVLSEVDALVLTDYLSELHQHFATEIPGPIFVNQAMRALNHESIFIQPFRENTRFDLDTIQPGLQELATPYKHDANLKNLVETLGVIYLADSKISNDDDSTQPELTHWTEGSKTLLHGDFCPARWLQTKSFGIKIIDPEFCFYGPAEFDLGVMIAHLMIAQQPASLLNIILTNYVKPVGFDESLRQRFTGIEIMRRLIGLSPLPLNLSIEQKRALLDQSQHMLQ